MQDDPFDFLDFDADDALESIDYTKFDLEVVDRLQTEIDRVNSIEDSTEQKNAAKALVRQLNGEE